MSDVYFVDFRSSSMDNITSKTKRLFERAGFDGTFGTGDFVAVKTHFGEYGNLAYLPAPLIRIFVDLIKERGAKPFVTDTNTLYLGNRNNALDHLDNAFRNGFLMESVGAPVIIADGLRGNDFREVSVDMSHYDTLRIASAVYDADAVIVTSHVKGHELYGIGGAIKNVAMGCVPPSGKQTIHSEVKPEVDREKCTSCGTCIAKCPVSAIAFDSDKKAVIDRDTCIGCGECVVVCPYDAIPVVWESDYPRLHERTAEYAKGIINTKQDKWLFFNYIMNVTPECDCNYWNDVPVIRNIGILASKDPVAIDRASADLINREDPLPGSKLWGKDTSQDNLTALHKLNWIYLYEYAERIGLGENRYNLIEL